MVSVFPPCTGHIWAGPAPTDQILLRISFPALFLWQLIQWGVIANLVLRPYYSYL